MKRFLRQALRWTAILLATLITLLLVFYAEEDWRGARDWAACQRDLAARGETLDLRQLVPPGNPQDDLSKVPIFAELYQKDGWDKARIRNVRTSLDLNNGSKIPKAQFLNGEPIDLTAWQKFYRTQPQSDLSDTNSTPAQDVLQTLKEFDPELNEVDRAVSNDYAYWPINYDQPSDTQFSGLTSLISIAQVLQLRAVAHLENQEPNWALQDWGALIRLNSTFKDSGFMVGYLVRAGVCMINDSILWEGIRRHAWTDAHLQQMELGLRTNMLAAARSSLRTERAYSLSSSDYIKQGGYKRLHGVMNFFDEAPPSLLDPVRLIALRPDGWWDQDKVFYSQEVQKRIDAIHLSSGTLDSSVYNWEKESASIPGWKKALSLGHTSLPSIDGFGVSIARAETYRRLARLACRLEEYRLAHGNQYPEKLDDLPDLPAHLNQEVLSEQPLHYQRKGDGYTLYSLGWNQKDDGGQSSTDPKEGDWPWPSP